MSAARKKPRPKPRRPRASSGGGGAAAKRAMAFSPTRIALVLVVLTASLAAWLWRPKPLSPATADDALEAVRPRHGDGMDPLVQSLVERRLRRVRASPASAAAHGELGLAYAANDLWDEARDSFQNAVTLGGDERLWRFHLALATRRAGDADTARELLERLAEDEASFAPVHQRLAEARLNSGDLPAALDAYRRVTELEPTAPDGYVGTAEVAIRERRYDDAVRDLEHALELDGGYKVAHYLLGLAYRGLGETAKAEQHLERGLGAPRRYLADPGSERMEGYAVNLTAQINRAGLMLQAGDASGAITLLEEALERRGDEVRLMNTLSMAYMRTHQLERARQLLLRARESDPQALATEVNLAMCHLRLGELDEALRWADAAARRAPEVGQTHFARALVLEKLGRGDDARAAAEHGARLDPQNPQARQLAQRLSR